MTTLADAFSTAPNTDHRARLLASLASVQSAIADAEAARVFTSPVASSLVDDLVGLASRIASEIRDVDPPEEPTDAEPPADDPAPQAETGPAPDPAVSELREAETEVTIPETEPADVDPPAETEGA